MEVSLASRLWIQYGDAGHKDVIFVTAHRFRPALSVANIISDAKINVDDLLCVAVEGT